MEYRGIRYTLRAGIERGQWSVVIYPQGVETKANRVFGTREDADRHARRMIDRWLEPKSSQRARVYSFFDLWNARATLRHYAITIGMICGGFAMGGVAQGLRLLVAIAHAIQPH
jgi:hypothetical protein